MRTRRRPADGSGLKELMRLAGVAVFAAELAAAIGVDGVGHREPALGDGLVQDGARGEGFELDEVAVVSVGARLLPAG